MDAHVVRAWPGRALTRACRRLMGLMLLCAAAGATFAACDWFDDPSPETATVRLSGDAGEIATLLISKQFIAGIDENDVTRVQVLQGDTLRRALPWDTTIPIRVEQRFFIRSLDADTVSNQLRMEVRIDGVVEYDQSRITSEELQFVYTFNQPVTNVIELI